MILLQLLISVSERWKTFKTQSEILNELVKVQIEKEIDSKQIKELLFKIAYGNTSIVTGAPLISITLPVEKACWKLKLVKKTSKNGCKLFYRISDQRGLILSILSKELIDELLLSKDLSPESQFSAVCALSLACGAPITGSPRRPLAVIDSMNCLNQINTRFVVLKVKPDCFCMLDETVLARACSTCGFTAEELLFTKCEQCKSAAYCSMSCAELIKENHQKDCFLMNKFQAMANQLANHHFTFTAAYLKSGVVNVMNTTDKYFDEVKLKRFLQNEGVFNVGLWRRESPNCIHCNPSLPYGELNDEIDPYVLPVEGITLEDFEIEPPGKSLVTWDQYYLWRGFRSTSPIAVLLQYCLTVCYIIQRSSCYEKTSLNVIVAGVDKEADLTITFMELCALIPDKTIKLYLLGPLISSKVSRTSERNRNLETVLYSGTVHQFLKENKRIHVDLIIGLNAGLAAYTGWRESIQAICNAGIEAYFTDYCLLSIELSKIVVEDMYRQSNQKFTLTEPTINPFRSPLRKYGEYYNLPWYSNAFITKLQKQI